MSEGTSPTFDEALRLVLAFYCIMEPEKRAVVAALIEKYADRSRLMEASAEAGGELFPVPTTGRTAAAQATMRQAAVFLRQRDYVDHVRDTSFSIIENAIGQLTRPSGRR